jgi:c-di-GMP-binding flagellar brake protein YcgR
LFVALPEPLPLQEIIRLSLRLAGPEGEHQVRAQGVVVRQVAPDPDSHLIPGVGVRFTEIDAMDERTIDHYVTRTIVEAGAEPGDDGADPDRS